VHDAQYGDPRLVALYDALNPRDASAELSVELCGAPPRRVLDLGCGTGQLALELAGLGHDVTAVDVAADMLAAARALDRADRVAWIAADARTLALPGRFDVAVMTGHVFQVFIDDETAAAVLARVRAHVVAGGAFAFDTRNPAASAWAAWHRAIRTVDVPALGPVTVRYEVRAVDGDVVRFATHHAFPTGEVVTSESALRFRTARAVRALVERAGFCEVTLYGDWQRGSLDAAAAEIVVVAR
jgi:SAM-dependent methyltransferase